MDYLILEAVAAKAAQEEKEFQKKAKVKQWQSDKSDLYESVKQ